jgi:hypothetical protein
MSNRAQLILILACVAGALGFVGYQVFRASGVRTKTPDAAFEERARLKEFTSNGVRVVVFIESDSKGQPLLRATFTPTAQGFHVYSKDLDPKATDGLGMATRLELLPHPSIRATGQLFADRAVERHDGLDIYPDGPVSLRLPIRFVGADTNLAAQVAVSYMACKTDGVCLRPVERQVLDIEIAPRWRRVTSRASRLREPVWFVFCRSWPGAAALCVRPT